MIAALLLALISQQPNAVVIVADDLGWPERALLPSLDALAAQGVTFDRCYSQPVCTISRIEFMYGQLHRRLGVGENIDAFTPGEPELPLSLVSLAEGLPGIANLLAGKWHLGRAPGSSNVASGPAAQGWTWTAGAPSLLNSQALGYYGWWRAEGAALAGEAEYATDVQLAQFTSWWASTPGQKVALLSWSAPHKPWDTPPWMSPGADNRSKYTNVVTYLDGALEAALAAIDLADTFVIFTCDNGTPETAYPPGQPPGIWKGTTYEGGVRVPTIVAGPGVAQGYTAHRLVSLVDIPATVAELLGRPAPSEWLDSQSFANELGSWPGSQSRAFVFAEVYGPDYDDQAVIEASWKLRRVDPDGAGPQASADTFYRVKSPGVEMPLLPNQATQARLLGELASLPSRAP